MLENTPLQRKVQFVEAVGYELIEKTTVPKARKVRADLQFRT